MSKPTPPRKIVEGKKTFEFIKNFPTQDDAKDFAQGYASAGNNYRIKPFRDQFSLYVSI